MTYSHPVVINSTHITQGYDCGKTALNDFLKKYALPNNAAGVTKTYVVTLEDQKTVVGFLSLAAGSVEHALAPERITKGTPRHPIPVILLARLGVDLNHQKKGIGPGMLKFAFVKILEVSKIIGVRAIFIQAKDQSAIDFYTKYGLVPSPIDPFHMFMLLKDCQKSLNLQGQ